MKKNKAKAERTSPRFGVLDAVIILLIIVAVVGVYFRYNIIDFVSSMRNLENYSVSYSVENIRYTTPTPNFINIGDEVYFADDGEHFGTLTNVSENAGVMNVTPASEYFTKSNGEVVEIMYPDSQSRVDAVGRLICTGNYSDEGGFLVNGKTFIAAGQYVAVRTEYVSLTIRIEEIIILEEE